ncbi:hypothetical protein CHARACLAT_011486 [Characodon lateralis]|uniref:Uncharacterized protein n=1 Tax=Characodon lateralis TaxID=208331 RepID=A0ABU7F243_9TELE|nr:hypothetical protein [Characodon lateralis]
MLEGTPRVNLGCQEYSALGEKAKKAVTNIAMPFCKIAGGHPPIVKTTYTCKVEGTWSLCLVVIGHEAGYTLDRSTVYQRATRRHTVIHTHATYKLYPPNLRAILERPINQKVMFLDCEKKLEYPERKHGKGEHANSMQTPRI